METLGQRIKACRNRLGLSQYELAAKVDMQQGDISKIERGVIAETTKIAQLAHTLGCHALWLATGKGPSGLANTLPSDVELRSNIKALMEARGVSDSARLADLIARSESEVAGLLTGTAPPSEGTIESIAAALDSDPMLLYIPTRHFQALIESGRPMRVNEAPAEAWDSFPPAAGADLSGEGNVVGIEVRGELRFEGDAVYINNADNLGFVLGSGLHQGYALKMDGSEASPVVKDGQYLVVDDSGGVPMFGDLCLIEASRDGDHRSVLAEFLNENERGYVVDVLPSRTRRSLRKEDVISRKGIVAVVSARQWSAVAPKQRNSFKSLKIVF